MHKEFGNVAISWQYHRTDSRGQERGRRVVCTEYPNLADQSILHWCPPKQHAPHHRLQARRVALSSVLHPLWQRARINNPARVFGSLRLAAAAPGKYCGHVSESINILTLVLNEHHPRFFSPTPPDSKNIVLRPTQYQSGPNSIVDAARTPLVSRLSPR